MRSDSLLTELICYLVVASSSYRLIRSPRAFSIVCTMRCETSYQTMIELLQGQAADQADRTAYAFLDDRDGMTEITFGELDRRAA